MIDARHREIVEKYFLIGLHPNGKEFYASGIYSVVDADDWSLGHYVIDCTVCGAVVREDKVLSHTIWHESLVYKND